MPLITNSRPAPLRLFPDRPSPRLYDRIIEVLRVRHYSRRTEEAYLHWMRRYFEFHQHRHSLELGEADVNRLLTHLAVKEHVAASAQNQALSALFFLYEHVLEQPLDRIEGVVRARRPKQLLVVLTADEVSGVMTHLTGDKWHHCDAALRRSLNGSRLLTHSAACRAEVWPNKPMHGSGEDARYQNGKTLVATP